MSASLELRPQADGYWRGWTALVGGDFGYEVVDDATGAAPAHDGDATYLILPKLVPPAGTASFYFFAQFGGYVPDVITLRVTAKIEAGAPRIQLGFARGPDIAMHETGIIPTESYVTTERVFATNPLTGGAWSADDIKTIEPCIRAQIGFFGQTRVTNFNGLLTAHISTNALLRVPRTTVTA